MIRKGVVFGESSLWNPTAVRDIMLYGEIKSGSVDACLTAGDDLFNHSTLPDFLIFF
jgi:hypothetical protein